MFTLIDKRNSKGWSSNSRLELSISSGVGYNTLRTWEKEIVREGVYYEGSRYIYLETVHLKSKRGNINNLNK